MPNSVLTYTQSIREATHQCMEQDESIFVMGLGVTYPNGGDGTTAGLVKSYPGRVFDMPCSEGAATGICVGSALMGMRPILVHGRVEFALLGFDQIVTQAAKWNYIFQTPIPIVIRASVGRRWGDGPQHTQVLHSVFGHIPGLKVVIPSTPRSAKGLLVSSILDNNPVLFLEHRWLYNISETVPDSLYTQNIHQCNIIRHGSDISIVANADTLIEVLRCTPIMVQHGIDPEIIDLVSVNPIDYETILSSVKKTGRIFVIDTGTKACGLGSEIISHICENISLLSLPVNVGSKDCPCPTSTALSEFYYPTGVTIVAEISKMFKMDIPYNKPQDFHKTHMPSNENIEEILNL